MYIGEVRTFPKENLPDLRGQALKVLEESAEVFSAVTDLYALEEQGEYWYRKWAVDECADVIMAVSNMLMLLGVEDFPKFMHNCEQRQKKRGGYGVQE